MTQIRPPERNRAEADLYRWHQTANIEFGELVSMGYIQGASLLSFGSTVTDLAAGDGKVLLYEGTLGYPTPLSASTVYLVSSSGSDTDVYKVEGTDANGDFQSVTVTATGTTPAAVSGTWNHVQRCVNTTAGGSNVGTVYVSTDASVVPTTLGDQIQTVMLPGTNYAINPVLVCPNNTVILIHRFDFSTNTTSDTKIFVDANREGTWIQNFVFFCDLEYHQTFDAPIKLYPGDKLRVMIQAAGGTANDATFGMNGVVLRADVSADSQKFSIKRIFE